MSLYLSFCPLQPPLPLNLESSLYPVLSSQPSSPSLIMPANRSSTLLTVSYSPALICTTSIPHPVLLPSFQPYDFLQPQLEYPVQSSSPPEQHEVYVQATELDITSILGQFIRVATKSEIWYLPMEANIDLSKISPTLFLDFTAQSLTYLLKPCKEAGLIEEIINAGNGAIVNEVGLYTITLMSPNEDYDGDEEVFSTKYIADCARENKQLNLNNYRVVLAGIKTVTINVLCECSCGGAIVFNNVISIQNFLWGSHSGLSGIFHFCESAVEGGGRRSIPAFAWRESGEYFGKTTLSTPDQDSNINLSVLGNLVYSESSMLDHAATKASQDAPILITLQQFLKPLTPEVHGVVVHISTLPGQFLKYQAMILLEAKCSKILPFTGIPDALACWYQVKRKFSSSLLNKRSRFRPAFDVNDVQDKRLNWVTAEASWSRVEGGPQNANTNNAVPNKVPPRTLYTHNEKKAIVKYIVKNNGIDRVKECERKWPPSGPIERVLSDTEYSGELVMDGSENMKCAAAQAVEGVVGAIYELHDDEQFLIRLTSSSSTSPVSSPPPISPTTHSQNFELPEPSTKHYFTIDGATPLYWDSDEA
uniref:Uncharacterized protein n=1 Tax=Timema douglasi TaxID=61478 RepID=A0A7R8VF72_TIMDO|nr:unnamed protein product [Timema douglasi]